MTESSIVRDVLRVLGGRADMRLWRNNTGVGRALANGQVVRFGLIGSSDCIGLLRDGRFLAVEAKTEHGRQSLQQRQFQKMIETFNGVYIVARSAEDAVEQLKARGY